MPSTMDNWRKERVNPQLRRHVGEDHPMPKPMNVSAIIPQQPLAYQNFLKKTHREFSNLGMTLAQTYENLTSKGFLKPLQPTLMPNPMPFTWNLNEYCHFHQKSSHKTDNCFRLKNEIQDLIDNGILLNPNIITKPKIRKSPLHDYHQALPLYQNCVKVEGIDQDCSKFIEVVEINVGNMHIRSGKLNGSTSFTIYNMHYVNFRIQV